MNMKRLLTLFAFFATLHASAQQVNPVPDYVFANRMSAGRNTVTDTAAYFSIGPRYGATRGMMPPMVVDTASFSANKRNGLLIFSVQKNKFLYWDSVGVKWAEMAGTGGSAITGSGVAGYMPEFTTATNLDTTRLFHSAGRFAIGSTTTTNGVFNVYNGVSYFDSSLRVGTNTLIVKEDENEVLINRSADAGAFRLQLEGNAYFAVNGGYQITRLWGTSGSYLDIYKGDGNRSGSFGTESDGTIYFGARLSNDINFLMNNSIKAVFNTNSEFLLNTTSDAGDYKLQVNGNSLFSGNIRTSAPIGGTANDWRLGTVASVSPTSPNRTIEVSIGGTIYYIAAKTTND